MTSPSTSSSTSSVAQSASDTTNALISGAKWGGVSGTGVTLSYSFPWTSASTATFSGHNGLGVYSVLNEQNGTYHYGLNGNEQAGARSALQTWANVANVTFFEVAESSSSVGDIRFAWTSAPELTSTNVQAWGWATYPDSYWPKGGDVWLSSLSSGATDPDWSAGSFNFFSLVHELGHALGLKHPFEASPILAAALDTKQYTVMAYTSHAHGLFNRVIQNADGSVSLRSFEVQPDTPMLYDVAAIQYLYGANQSYRTGNDLYTFDPATPFFRTLWDAGGTDTISVANFSKGCVIDLQQGHFSKITIESDSTAGYNWLSAPVQATYDGTDNLAIAYGCVIENAIGGSGNDILMGNGSNNNFDGGAGTDIVNYAGTRANYTIVSLNGGFTISSAADGTDFLKNVEFAAFLDQSVNLGTFDATAPTVTITDNLPGTANRSTVSISYALLFSKGVTGLDASDFTVSNASVSSVTGSGTSWAVSLTPTLGVENGVIGLTLKAGALSDATGNLNPSASNTSQAIDTAAPVAPKVVTSAAFNFLVDPQVTMQTSLGTVVLELEPQQAPITVANMLAYVNASFYDNTLFHRVIPGFMVQGGGFGAALASKTPTYGAIALESDNGLSNLRGSIAMARTSVADSSTSQFFVNLVDNAFLNYSSAVAPGYAVFGKVVSGLAVIDSIAHVPTSTLGQYANVPLNDVTITSILQTVAGSSIASTAILTVAGLEAGAQWSYSLNGGATWAVGTGNSFAAPAGNYPANAILVTQTDVAGNLSSAGKLSSALVVDTSAPTVSRFSPSDEAGGVTIASNIVIAFSEAIQHGTGTITLKTTAGAIVESFDVVSSSHVTMAGNTVTINPTADLAYGAGYRVELASGTVTDLAGNGYAGTSIYNFTTNYQPAGSVAINGTPALGQTLRADTIALADADGLGALAYQWRADNAAIAGANGNSLTLNQAQMGKTITLTVSYTDGHGTSESVSGGFPRSVDLMAYSWKAHTLLDGVSVSGASHSAMTDLHGAAGFTAVTDTSLVLTSSRAIPAAEAVVTSAAVNLQDAIDILKMIVGLDVNGASHALSPYQRLAADFDGNGTIGLTDAIGVLKHVVGLSSPEPAWHFVNEADLSVPGKTGLSLGTAPATISADLSGTSPIRVGLVGYLAGDVDGSYAGASGAADMDITQPGYFTALVASHAQLSLSQFGVYAN